ncbi:Methyl-accepting chemotaxis protein [Rubrivivax sp. A210]|uniref:methyl-accepting chemotaxis protein n=1 Tax=Rubrivivax sp. A210 TaxID=2772301 RepID=UPI00191A18AC|nr:methyl-accepting chemotaxis protein [Rubrivivax sp. A210]CAD5372507.1 Methyl-accepting chemotaxis protein [Rubrivivax sp. A210]
MNSRLSIAQRLTAGVVGVVVFVTLAAGLTYRLSMVADEALHQAEADASAGTALAGGESALWNLRFGMSQFMSGDETVRKQVAEMEPRLRGAVSKAIERFNAHNPKGAEQQAMAALQPALDQYLSTRARVFELHAAGKVEEARELQAAKAAPLGNEAVKLFGALITIQDKAAGEDLAIADRELVTERSRIITLLALLAAASTAAGLWFVRSLRQSLTEVNELARRFAQGDLTALPDEANQHEIGRLARSLGQMAQSLRGLIGNMSNASDSIGTASAEIASGNLDLSSRTEQTASSLQQTSASMAHLTETVNQTAESARTAQQLASSASEVAARGGNVVAEVVTTMDEINASSKRISDIIGTIDGIAFQTNILALNAAVEAARAGEQGRGFAVVASEVRSLAQRSASAAREIKSLIGASVDKVESGTRLVQDAGTTMQEIVASVQRVTDIIGEISAAAAEQSSGIGSVNAAISQLDQMTQQNAALVEQSAAAAESMREQAQQLVGSLAGFRLASGSAGAPLTPRLAAPTGIKPAPARAAARPAAARPAAPAPTRAPAIAQPATPRPAPAAAGGGSDDWETF